MFVESLIKETVELQGFRVVTVQKTGHGLEATLAPNGRFALCCGACRKLARYRDTSATLCFWHVPLWGMMYTFSMSRAV